MSTRENTTKPKNYITTPIGKQLLTPCRRVGLSRSKKTPKNVEATCQSHSNTTMPQNNKEESNRSTKLVKKHEVKKTKNCDLIATAEHSEDTKPKEICQNRPEEDSPPQQSLAIKTVVQVEVPTRVKRSINFDKAEEAIPKKPETNDQNIKKNISTNIPITSSGKRKLDLSTSSDNNKCKKLNTTLSLRHMNSCDAENKEKGITLGRFTTEDYLNEYCKDPETFTNYFESKNDSFDYVNDELALKKPEKKKLIVSLEQLEPKTIKKLSEASRNLIEEEDGQFASSPSISSEIEDNLDRLKQDFSRNSQAKPLKEADAVKLSSSLVKQEKKKHKESFEAKSRTGKSKLSIPTVSKINLDEEDDLFTSSPQSEKQERENLLKLVEKVEKDIKKKEEKLDRLKQAKVYKMKYSPEKLKNPVDQWTQGCKSGLIDLLVKMQEFGPIDMNGLLKKLNIPSNIVKRLDLSNL